MAVPVRPVDLRGGSVHRSRDDDGCQRGDREAAALRSRSDDHAPARRGVRDRVTAGFNFADADQMPPRLFNQVIRTGLR